MKHQRSRQLLVGVLITVHLVTVYGCYSTEHLTLPGNEIPVGSDFKIATVILKDGEIIEFGSEGGRYIEKISDGKSFRVIVGTAHSKEVQIDPENVLEVKFEQERPNSTGSFIVGLLVGMPVGALVLVAIVAASFYGH